jgi:hypothetical protein
MVLETISQVSLWKMHFQKTKTVLRFAITGFMQSSSVVLHLLIIDVETSTAGYTEFCHLHATNLISLQMAANCLFLILALINVSVQILLKGDGIQ